MVTRPVDDVTSPARTDSEPDLRKVKRAAIAAFLGTSLEYYEFYVYGSAAALIFGRVFFPAQDAFVGTLLSLATFAIAYLVRPVAAAVLGTFGDRIGRKKMLIFILTLMGTSTFLIGCLPTYEQVGIWAPILLICLRILQGVSVAGEQAGSSTLTLEHAPAGRRAFFTSFTPAGSSAGFLIATLVFATVAMLPDDMLLSWGWRVPFWASFVLVIGAYLVRRHLDEPEVFVEETDESGEPEASPLATLLRTHRAALIRVVIISLYATIHQIPPIFAVAFATSPAIGISRSTMLWVSVACFTVQLIVFPFAGLAADRFGRKPLFIAGVFGCGVMIFAYFGAITSGNLVLIFVAAIAMNGLLGVLPNAIYPSFFGEMFNVKVRFTGLAVGTQLGFVVGGLSPTIAWAMIGDGGTNWMPVALLFFGLCTLSSIAALTARETYRTPLTKLGNPV